MSGAGENAQRRTSRHRACKGMARGGPADDGQPRLARRTQILDMDRIAVDGGIVGAGTSMGETTSSRQDAREGSSKSDRLGLGERRQIAEDPRLRAASTGTGAVGKLEARKVNRPAAAADRCEPAMGDDEIGDRADIVDADDRQRAVGQGLVAQHGDDMPILRIEQGLAGLAAMDLELVMRLALEALDDQQIDRRHASHQLRRRRLRLRRGSHASSAQRRSEATSTSVAPASRWR